MKHPRSARDQRLKYIETNATSANLGERGAAWFGIRAYKCDLWTFPLNLIRPHKNLLFNYLLILTMSLTMKLTPPWTFPFLGIYRSWCRMFSTNPYHRMRGSTKTINSRRLKLKRHLHPRRTTSSEVKKKEKKEGVVCVCEKKWRARPLRIG